MRICTATWKMRIAMLLAFLTLATCPEALGQQTASKQESKSPDDPSNESFLALRDRRDDLTRRSEDAERALKDLQTSEYWLAQEEDANNELTRKEKSGRLKPEERSRLEKKIEDARSAAATNSTLDQVRTLIKQKQMEVDDFRKRRDTIDAEMSRRIDLETPKQKFKTNMSIVFALLVGIVIFGFFVIAFRDPTVRQEIFSGSSGIQFVTLFSLVIAIILFGITGILEGKELAALLGGLSGYILGKGSATKGQETAQVPVASIIPPH